MQNGEIGSALCTSSLTPRKGDPTYFKDTALLLPVVPGAGEVGVGAGAGAGSEVFCQHR